MDVFLENAQRIFDVARSDDGAEPKDFALLIRPDGGLHFVMESPLSRLDSLMLDAEMPDAELEPAASIHDEALIAYRVTKSPRGEVRVAGRSGNRECVLTQHSSDHSARNPARRFSSELLRDQPLYWISSPLTLSASS